MIRVEFDADDFKKGIRKLIEKVEDPTELWEAMGQETLDQIDDSFNTQASPFGRRWAPHALTTVRIHGSHRLLQLSGRLRARIRASVDREGLTIEVKSPYAGVHQWGNPSNKVFGRGRGPIPARPFMPITEDEISTDLLQKFNTLILNHYKVD